MKNILSAFSIALISLSVLAQAPQKMSYQAIIRDAANNLITNHSIGMKISILQGSESGAPVYIETQTENTNSNGLLSIEIGTGSVVSGSFSTIDWADGPYWLKTETDPTGGTNYTITGISQLLSVPYALYAKTAENEFSGKFEDLTDKPNTVAGYGINDFDFTGVTTNDLLKFNGTKWVKFTPNYLTSEVDGSVSNEIQTLSLVSDKLTISGTGGNTVTFTNWDKDYSNDVRISEDQKIWGHKTFADKVTVPAPVDTSDAVTKKYVDASSPVHYIGENYGGGIVFYVYDNGQHGLIAATTDQSNSMRWCASGVTGDCYINTMARADGIGAGKANTYIIIARQGMGTGTYAARVCNEYSVTVNGAKFGDWYLPSKYELNLLYQQKAVVGGFSDNGYRSSTEINEESAWGQNFNNGQQLGFFKDYIEDILYHIRAIRTF